jgi:phage shock protein PspC (stress-responsive transcriptional regulator)
MSTADELEKLRALHTSGALSDAEYAHAKAQLLGTAPSASGTVLQRLVRSRTDRVLGGVCGGLGAHTGLPSWAWRILFVASVVCFGFGILIYVLLWLFMPEEARPVSAS